MKNILNIVRWIGVSLFAIMSLGALFSGGLGILAFTLFAIGGLLILPLPFISKFRQNLKLNKVLSIVLSITLFIIATLLISTGNTNNTNNDNNSSTLYAESNEESPTNSSSTDASSNLTFSDSNQSTTSTDSSQKVESNVSDSSSSTTDSSVSNTTHTHNYIAANCTTPKTCSNCGETIGDALGHRWIAATYDAPKTCSVCGATEGNTLAVPNSENYHGHVYTGGSSSKKYHYESECAGKNSHEITWDEVSKRNLGPCGTCVLK